MNEEFMNSKMKEMVKSNHPCVICGSKKQEFIGVFIPDKHFRATLLTNPPYVLYAVCGTCFKLPEKQRTEMIEQSIKRDVNG